MSERTYFRCKRCGGVYESDAPCEWCWGEILAKPEMEPVEVHPVGFAKEYAMLLASANSDVKRLSAYVDKLEAERDKWKESAADYAETVIAERDDARSQAEMFRKSAGAFRAAAQHYEHLWMVLHKLLSVADERTHRLYECRLEEDKLLVMIERYEQERKTRAKLRGES